MANVQDWRLKRQRGDNTCMWKTEHEHSLPYRFKSAENEFKVTQNLATHTDLKA